MKITRTLVFVVSTLVYIASLTQCAFVDKQDGPVYPGCICLMIGFGYAAWYANPLLLVSHMLMLGKKMAWALGISMAALLVALTTLGINEVPGDEGGVSMVRITGYSAGFYLWLASIAVAVVGQAALIKLQKPQGPPPLPKREEETESQGVVE